MERRIGQDNIILLCDSYSPDSKRLHECFQQADIDCLAVVMEEDYFLPEGVVSIYDFLFYGSNAGNENTGKPKYFNGYMGNERGNRKIWEDSLSA